MLFCYRRFHRTHVIFLISVGVPVEHLHVALHHTLYVRGFFPLAIQQDL